MQSLRPVLAVFDSEGTVFGSIGKRDFHQIRCIRPPREIVLAYDRLAATLDTRVEMNERTSRTLAALRDALLPKLVSGELRVTDAERIAASTFNTDVSAR